MKTMRFRTWLVLTTLVLPACLARGDEAPSDAPKIPLIVDRSPARGPTEGLDPQVLDFRYRPDRWQTCIGLVDDPHKTMVGDNGGLYYEYGKQGPAPYSFGHGSFGTGVLIDVADRGESGPPRQSLRSPRIPIVITERACGSWLLRQEAWSGRMRGAAAEPRGANRVDYLAVVATNQGATAAARQVTLEVGATTRLVLDDERRRLLLDGDVNRVFCQFSRPCDPPATGAKTDDTTRILSDAAARVLRNWANPRIDGASRFRHVLVGEGGPLEFRATVEPGGRRHVALGLIEGWHAEPGRRPLRLAVEGTAGRDVDLVEEYGANVSAVLTFAAHDVNGDGILSVEVLPVPDAVDRNTILSALWVFPADAPVTAPDLLAGRLDTAALAIMDADAHTRMTGPLRLTWSTGTVGGGESFELLLALPQGEAARRGVTLAPIDAERQRCIEYWQQADLPYDRMSVPDPAVQALLDASIRNVYQAREWKDGKPKFQVGPTCYRGTWAADGPFLLEAVSYLGRPREARAGLEQQVDGDDGPGGVEFSKKSGLRLWMVWRHAQLTGDLEWLERMWPRVQRDVHQIMEYRAMTRDDPTQANYGLMPIGFGDGGLGGIHREYTNVYWTLAGLRAAIEMADQLRLPVADSWRTEYDDYREVFDRARQRDRLVDAEGHSYVPVTMQGEEQHPPQRGAWAFLQSVFPGRIFDHDDPLMRGTMAMLDANQSQGLIFGTGWIPEGIWTYAASFYGHAHLWLGHGPKAAATLYAFGNHASPLLCWREEQNLVGAPTRFIGDMPHNWASAEFIRMVRHLVLLERGDELHVCEALPQAWTRPGAVLRMLDVPTSFGEVTLEMHVAEDGRSARITVDPPRRRPPSRIVLHLQGFARNISAVESEEPATFTVRFGE